MNHHIMTIFSDNKTVFGSYGELVTVISDILIILWVGYINSCSTQNKRQFKFDWEVLKYNLVLYK